MSHRALKVLTFTEPQLPIQALWWTSVCNYLKALYYSFQQEQAGKRSQGWIDRWRDQAPAMRNWSLSSFSAQKVDGMSVLPLCSHAVKLQLSTANSWLLGSAVGTDQLPVKSEMNQQQHRCARMRTRASWMYVCVSQAANFDATTWS